VKKRISAYYLLSFLAVGAGPPFLTLLLRQRGLIAGQIGVLLAIGAIAGAITQPLIGHLSDYLDRPRRILAVSAVLAPLFFLGYEVLPDYWMLFFVAVMMATVQSAAPLGDALALGEGERYGFAYGEVRLFGALGYALIVAVAGYVYHRTGMGFSVWGYALLTLPLLVVIGLLPSRSHTPRMASGMFTGIFDLFRRGKLIGFISIAFLVSTAMTVNATYLPLYYLDLHYPMQWVGLNFTVAALTEIPVFYVSGRIITKLGRMPVVVFGTSCYALKYAIMANPPGSVAVILWQSLDGVAYALYWSASVDMVSHLAPANRKGSAQTLFGSLAGSLSTVAGSAGGGWLLDSVGAVHLYAVLASFTTAAVFLYGLFWFRLARS